MRRLALSLAVLAVLFVLADRTAGHVLRGMFEDPRDGKTASFLAGARLAPDIAIAGSSRAKYHYAADSMSRWLGRAVFNFGSDGQHAPQFYYSVARILLRRHVPQVWVMEIDDRQLFGDEGLQRLDVLLPYAGTEPAVRDILAERSFSNRLALASRAYPYNSLILSLLKALRTPEYRVPRNGFEPLDHDYREVTDAPEPGDPGRLNEGKLRYLNALFDLLATNGVRVVAVRSPTIQQRSPVRAAEVTRFLSERCIPYIDMSSDPSFADKRWFADHGHLNERGATRFSRVIADSLRSILARPIQRGRRRVSALGAGALPTGSGGFSPAAGDLRP